MFRLIIWEFQMNILEVRFLQAYIALVQRAKVQPGETVLIHAGCSAIGIAAISIAAVAGCTIYTTVSTDYQRAFLKKHFSFVRISTSPADYFYIHKLFSVERP